VTSVAEAREWVNLVRFPPLGRRGFDGAGADAQYALDDPLEYLNTANDNVFLVLQVEDKECVDSVEEIAALPGVDMLFVGPGDLTISYGIPFQFDHPLLQSAIERVANATEKAGKWWGIPTGSPKAAQRFIDMGARLVTGGNDHVFLMRGFQESIESFKTVQVHR
jgi:4-hydroxy-2-oxoheptanedioate aldolase